MKIRIALLAALLATAASAADIVVVVNPKAGVDTLTPEQISNIFLGKATSLPNGTAVTPIDQNDGPIREEFDTKALKKDSAGVRGYWAKMQFTGKGLPPKETGGSADVKKAVAGNAGLIGYMEKSAVDGSVKVVGSF